MNCREVLGVTEGASREDIRRAFRRKVLSVHPDKGGDIEDFHKLHRAYEMLMSQEETDSEAIEQTKEEESYWPQIQVFLIFFIFMTLILKYCNT